MILSTEEKMGCNHSAAHISLDVLLAALRKTRSKAELCLPSLVKKNLKKKMFLNIGL